MSREGTGTAALVDRLNMIGKTGTAEAANTTYWFGGAAAIFKVATLYDSISRGRWNWGLRCRSFWLVKLFIRLQGL